MNKEALKKAEKYLASVVAKQSDKVPTKHLSHPNTYRDFLNKEVATTKAKVERLKSE